MPRLAVSQSGFDGCFDERQFRRQSRALVVNSGFYRGQARIYRIAQRFEGLLQQFLLRGVVDKTLLHRRFDQFQFRLKRGCLAGHRRRHGRKFLFDRAGEPLHRLLEQFQRILGIEQSVFQGLADQVELGGQACRLVFHNLRQGQQALRERAGERLDRLLKQFLALLFIGKAFLDGRLDQGQLDFQARSLALHRRLNGREFLAQRARQRLNRRLKEGLLRLTVGKAVRHRCLDQSKFRLQTRGLALHRRFNGREFLAQRAGKRRHSLLQQLLRLLAVGKAAGHGSFNQTQLLRQRPVRTSYRIDDLVVIRLHRNADVGPHIVTRSERHRQEQQQRSEQARREGVYSFCMHIRTYF